MNRHCCQPLYTDETYSVIKVSSIIGISKYLRVNYNTIIINSNRIYFGIDCLDKLITLPYRESQTKVLSVEFSI